MKVFSFILFLIPISCFSQYATSLELSMYDFSKVVVEIDSLQFDQCEQLSVTGLEPGEHQITVFQPKSYFDPVNGKLSTRLIQVYNGPLVLFEDKCTTCVIDKYHQQSIVIK